ncbi:MAG: terminase small subunit [Bdellovibrionales bacterium]|nr:terminase small subunit [Bdellovibrionales bacterium]
MAKDLTPKQKRFVEEYLVDLNATQAAIRAKYSENTAGSQAFDLLKKPEIQAAIQAEMDKRSKRTNITADNVLKELMRIATADLSGAYDEQGRLKPIHEIPEDTRRAMSGIKVFEEFDGFGQDRVKIGEVREVKFWDKPKSLEILARHLKLLTDKVEVSGSVTISDRLAKARKRVRGE